MAVAYFMGHGNKGFSFHLRTAAIVAVLCCFIFLYLAAAGGGAWTVDALLDARRAARVPATPKPDDGRMMAGG